MSVLVSERMRRILKDAAATFDWVIIDTPPMGLLSDAHLLVNLIDTVVLVIRAGATPLKTIQSATEAVGRDRILGVVLNRTAALPHAEAHHYYGTRAHDAVSTS
jgi:Mrp family chromosome partitioning ATPase